MTQISQKVLPSESLRMLSGINSDALGLAKSFQGGTCLCFTPQGWAQFIAHLAQSGIIFTTDDEDDE
jgi:hypothetical protein